ncbi:hypothetical protein MBLNU459_g5806t1 [Dothideomycetes sp. NU459]
MSSRMGPPPKPVPAGLYSKSTPNLPTLRSLNTAAAQESAKTTATATGTATAPATAVDGQPPSPSVLTSPSEAASLEDFSLDALPAAVDDSGSSSASDSGSDSGPISSLPQTRPMYAHLHSRSHTYLGPSSSTTFAPPFYNRPPTPLPPSPSLTSLLRPSFSTQTSRPTTPDPSSDEGGGGSRGGGGGGGGGTASSATLSRVPTGAQTPNSAAASATLSTSFRAAKPIPRASPKVPTYEYYGFTLYLTSSLAFGFYVLWSVLPSPFLHQLGIHYYPNRWWALAIPAWLVMLVVWVFVALASYNTGHLTLEMKNLGALVDDAANIAVVDRSGKIVRSDRFAMTVANKPGGGAAGDAEGRKGGQQSRSNAGSRRASAVDVELDWTSLWNEGTDAVMDVPIGGVCEVLYGQAREELADGDAPW